MKYFFILGNNPTLSLAELAAIFKNGEFSLVQNNIAILESTNEIAPPIMEKIGGTVKFGLIHNELNSSATKEILSAAAAFALPEKSDSKFNFGISYYGKSKINLKVLGMEFKKTLKESGVNSRWVISREPTLSSVVVEQNKLIGGRGAEIVIIQFNKKFFLGKTLAVQPFKELSFRDYGRPARDDRSGMLPPKLAQIMLNLSGAGLDGVILDPFCGSGTVITEAALMGFKNLIGADVSEKAIRDTKTNISWTEKNYKLREINYKIFHSDAKELSKHLKPESVDAVITEPYLGPQRGVFNIGGTAKELEQLYTKSLGEFKKILKSGGRIIMVWPLFFDRRKNVFLNPDFSGFKIVNPIPENLRKNIFIKLTDRNTIVYGREQQKVWREIVVMEKK